MNSTPVVLPGWLNEDFLLQVIREIYKENTEVKLSQYEVSPAGAPGDNYICDIFRVSVTTGDEKSLSLIVKCLPSGEFNLKFIRNSKLFEKEILVYDTILLSMCSIGKHIYSPEFTPECFLTRNNSIIVLEDLSPLGYKPVNRLIGLNLVQCIEALKTLAHFHALSIGLNPEQLASDFEDTVYSGVSKPHAVSYVRNSVLSVSDRVEKWSGFEHFADKLRHIASSSCDRILKLFATEFPFRVLNHGDFWTNNILFRYTDDGKIDGIKIIDFQMCRYASPVFDLLYFLYTSPQEEVRLKNRQLLLEEYYNEFVCIADGLHLGTTLSLEDLNKAMEENAFYGFINAIMMLPAVLSSSEETPDLANVAQGKSGMEWLSGEGFRHQFQNILKEFESKGLL